MGVIYKVTLSRTVSIYEDAEIEVEADTLGEAREAALLIGINEGDTLTWLAKGYSGEEGPPYVRSVEPICDENDVIVED